MSEYGKTLARYRDEAGLSQRELGAAIGLDYTQLNKIEHGHRPPLRAKYMEPLVRALRLKRSEAEKLVDLAGLSYKVLDFMDEVTADQVVKLKKQASSASIPTTTAPAISISDSVLDATFDQIEADFESRHLSKEERKRWANGIIEVNKLLLNAIKPEHQQ